LAVPGLIRTQTSHSAAFPFMQRRVHPAVFLFLSFVAVTFQVAILLCRRGYRFRGSAANLAKCIVAALSPLSPTPMLFSHSSAFCFRIPILVSV